MALLEKVNGDDYTLGAQISTNGTIFLCKPKDNSMESCIAKKITTKGISAEEIRQQGDKLKSSLLKTLYIVLPDYFWEDKKEECVYVLMDRHVKSMQEIISEHKRTGQYIPMKILKKIAGDCVAALRKIHSKKLYHGHIKTGNILVNEEEEYNLSDLSVFSQAKGEEYYSPEYVLYNQNQSQRYLQGSVDITGDQQKGDVWQLGICFVEIATLKKANDLILFRDQAATQSEQLKMLKDSMKKRYSKSFVALIEAMLVIPPLKRRKIQDIEEQMQDFIKEEDIELENDKLEPDTQLILQEMKNRLARNSVTVNDYFLKYEMQPQTLKIRTLNFLQGLEDLDLTLSQSEKACLEKLLDPKDSGYINLTDMIRDQSTQGIKMIDLKPDQTKNLKELLTEMNGFLTENNINLLSTCVGMDKKQRRCLDVVEFNEILTDLGLGLNKDDLVLVRSRYDPEHKGVIYYDFFCTEIGDSKLGSDKGLDTIMNEMYTTIRDKFNTFASFFKKYDAANRGFLKPQEFTQFLGHFNLNPASPVLKSLYSKFDPDNRQQLLYSHIRNAFQDLVDQEIKSILTQIAFHLNDQKIKFVTLVKNNTKSNRVINADKLFDGLRSINIQIRRPDLSFLLNQLNADKTEDVEFLELSSTLSTMAKTLGVQYLQVFSGEEDKKNKQNFDEPEPDTARSVNFNSKNFESCKRLIIQILKELDSQGKGASQYFRAKNGKMERSGFRETLKKLKIDQNDFADEYDDLMLNIICKDDKQQIDADLLMEALLYYSKQIPLPGQKKSDKALGGGTGYLVQHAAITYFSLINKALKKQKLDFNLFKDQDRYGEGTIIAKTFDKLMLDELILDIEDQKYAKFTRTLQEPDDDKLYSIKKLQKGLEEDMKADQMLLDLNKDIQQGRLDAEKVFSKYDRNKNVLLEMQEFKRLIQDMVEKEPNDRIVEVLYMKLDSNGDQTISTREFHARITGEVLKEEITSKKSQQQDPKGSTKTIDKSVVYRNVSLLKDSLIRENLDPKVFDKRGKGVCQLSAFNDILTSDLGFEANDKGIKSLVEFIKTEDDPKLLDCSKLQQLMEDTDEAQKLLQSLNEMASDGTIDIEKFFYQFDDNNNDTLELREFQKLVRDMEPTARQKPIETLFYSLDSNGDNTIQIKEFKSKVTGKQQLKSTTRFDKQKESVDISKSKSKKDPAETQAGIIDFIVKSPYLPEALEKLDTEFNNVLSCQQVVTAFEDSRGPPVTADEIKQCAMELNAMQAGKVNYKILVKTARDKANMNKSSNTGSKLQKVCEKIKQDLQYKDVDLLSIAKQYDRDESGMVKSNAIIGELKDRGLRTSQDDYDLVFSFLIPDEKGRVNYEELNNLIISGPEAVKKKEPQSKKIVKFKQDSDEDEDEEASKNKKSKAKPDKSSKSKMKTSRIMVDEAYDQVIDSCISYLERMSYSIVAFFRRCDKNQDGQLSLAEFSKMLENTVEIYLENEDVVERVFDRFDTDGDQKVAFQEMENALIGKNRITPQQIMGFKQGFLGNKDLRNEKQMQQLFSQITNGQDITYPMFCKYAKQIQPEISIIELDQQFRYFDRNQTEKLNYPTFVGVMREQVGGLPPQNPNQRSQQKQTSYVQTPQQQQQYNPPQAQYIPPQQQYEQQQFAQQPTTINQWKKTETNVMDSGDLGNPMASPNSQFEPGIQPPAAFDRYYYEEQLRTMSTSSQTDLFDVFCQYDSTAHPDFVLSNVQDLQNVFAFYQIKAPLPHISQFFYYYSHNSEILKFTEIYLRISTPGKLVAKALNFTMMKHQNYTPDYLWNAIGNKQPSWTVDQFRLINNNLKLGLNTQEEDDAFRQWDKQKLGKIVYQDYFQILKTAQIIQPKMQSGVTKTSKIPSQQETLNQFLIDLSAQVLSRKCFNLYEYCDPNKSNLISVGDFEKTTKQIMPDLQPQEIQAVRQLMSKEGYLNLSDLAQALHAQQSDDAAGIQGDKFNIQNEKKQFGINQNRPAQSKKPPPNQQVFSAIMAIINDFLKKKQKNYDDFANYYFPPGGNSTVDKPYFVNRTMEGSIGLNANQADDLFDYLDINQSGHISMNEFRIVFPTQQKNQVKNVENIVMGKEIEEEIKELFDKIDGNQSNSIDQRELQKSLCSIGINPSVEELQSYFRMFDKNNDGTINYEEFSVIVKDMLKKEMLNAGDLLEELRKEFRAVCNPITRSLGKEQVKQVFGNLNVTIKAEELDTLFEEIDQDKSGSVDIDEFIYFIQKNQSGMSAKASAAVMNIKGARRISLHDLRDLFIQMPGNFIMSFIRNQNKKLLNLPSSVLKPKLDSSGFFYQDLLYVEASNFNIKNSVLDKSNLKINICLEIRVIEITGVPIPDANDVPRNQFISREIGFILFDKSKNRFEGNSAYIKAEWKPEYEDRWTFDGKEIESTILLKWANFDEHMDTSVDLILEMITYINKKGTLIQISCSYAQIPVISLKQGKQYLDLKGGAPSKELLIDSKDVRTNRTGWRQVVKSLSGSIKTQAYIEIFKVQNPQQIQQISAFPNRIIVNKWAIPFVKGYREYFAYRTAAKGDTDLALASESRMKAWMNAIDCPDTYRQLANFWSEFIEPKCTNHQFQLNTAQCIGDTLYLMFVNSDFKFSPGDPTKRVSIDPVLSKKRLELINDVISDLKYMTGLVPQNQQQIKKPTNFYNMDPLNVLESMDNDDEDELASIDRFLQRKQKKLQQINN